MNDVLGILAQLHSHSHNSHLVVVVHRVIHCLPLSFGHTLHSRSLGMFIHSRWEDGEERERVGSEDFLCWIDKWLDLRLHYSLRSYSRIQIFYAP